jgi:hypothetical protein
MNPAGSRHFILDIARRSESRNRRLATAEPLRPNPTLFSFFTSAASLHALNPHSSLRIIWIRSPESFQDIAVISCFLDGDPRALSRPVTFMPDADFA